MHAWRLAGVLAFCSGCLGHVRGSYQLVEDVDDFPTALFQLVGARLQPGHRVELVENGAVFDAIVREIGQAKHSIDIVTYIWHSGRPSDRIVQALAARPPGVTCRVLVDPLGSPEFENVAPELAQRGCETHVFRPITRFNLFERNHRKMVIVDGATGIIGGFGVRSNWSGDDGDPEWRDSNLIVRGPAVNDMQRAFVQNWQEAGGRLLPASDFPTVPPEGEAEVAFVSSTASYQTDAERLVHLAIASARHRVWIENAYFIPDGPLVDLMARKRRQGVDIRIIAPGDHNDVKAALVAQRRTYKHLLQAGVRVLEYEPVMMHAKTMLVDDRLAIVGSINYNELSFTRLEEAAVVVIDRALVSRMAESWLADARHSHAVLRPRRQVSLRRWP
jgi:cardiolipin synthase